MSAAETIVRSVIAGVTRTDVSTLGKDDDLVEHLGIDSLQGLQILAGVEKRLDLRLPDEELVTLRTIGRILAAVEHCRSAVRDAPARAAPDGAAGRRDPGRQYFETRSNS
jgi:acyl carrier protein